VATIGITDYAQSELETSCMSICPPRAGRLRRATDLQRGESVKTVSDVYSPVSGEVREVNPALEPQSELLNIDPYGKGWMSRFI